MIEIIGWTGGLLFALCGIPQAWKCWKQGHAHGLSYSFLAMWTGGEILTLIYVLMQNLTLAEQGPFLLNYIANLMAMMVIWRYRLFPKDISSKQ